MNGAGFDEKKRHLFWTEAANTVTYLENITIRKGTSRTPHYLFYGSDAPYTQHLQVFGKMAIVKVLNPTNKLSDKGMKAIFVSYAEKHAGNVYRFINPSTNKIVLSGWKESTAMKKMLSHQSFQMSMKTSRVTKKQTMMTLHNNRQEMLYN